MTKQELLNLYISMLTNYSMTYEEFRTSVVEQDPKFPGIAKVLSTDGSNEYLYEFRKIIEKSNNQESENDNTTETSTSDVQSDY